MNKEEIEYAELRLKVPKGIVDFLRAYETAMGESAEGYLEYKIVDTIHADLEAWEDSPYFDSPYLIERFGLDKVFKEILFPAKAMEEAMEKVKEFDKRKGIVNELDQIIAHLQKRKTEILLLKDKL